MLPPISRVLLRYGHQPCRDFKLLAFYKNCGETTDAGKKKRGGGSNFIEFQRLSDRTMALIITAGSRDGKNYTDCNSLCTSHPGRLPRAAPSFAFSLSQPINYSLLTLESKLKQPAAHHQNRRSSRWGGRRRSSNTAGPLVHGCTRVRTRSGFDESVDRQQPCLFSDNCLRV